MTENSNENSVFKIKNGVLVFFGFLYIILSFGTVVATFVYTPNKPVVGFLFVIGFFLTGVSKILDGVEF